MTRAKKTVLILSLLIFAVPAAVSMASSTSGGGKSTVCNGFLPYPCAPNTPTTNAPIWDDTPPFLPAPAYNQVWIEPHSGERAAFITDPTHPCGTNPAGTEFVTNSYSGQQAISDDGKYIVVSNAPEPGGEPCIIQFDENTFQAGSSSGPLSMRAIGGTFNKTEAHIFYGPDASSPFLIKSCDVSTGCASYTTVVDLSSSANCPNIGSLTQTSNGEVTMSADGQTLAYWGDGAQDSAHKFWVYNKSKGCLWVDMVTGDENAAPGWGLPTTCSGCISVSERASSTVGHAIHRATLSLLGDYVVIENQNVGSPTYKQIYQVPTSTVWPVTPIFHCTYAANASDCQNHHSFGYQDAFVNGAGDTGAGSNQVISWRLRNLGSTMDTAGSFLSGFTNLINSINPGNIPSGSASHQSWAAADPTVVNPFASAQYMASTGVTHVTTVWQQEIDLINPRPTTSTQNVWRIIQHHLKAQVGSMTNNGGVVGNGATTTVTTLGPDDFSAGESINAYNCKNPSFNSSSITVAAVVSTTTFTYSSSLTGTTDCMFDDPSVSKTEFWAESLVQQSPDGHYVCTPDNWERTFPADTSNPSCNSKDCPQIHILCVETR
jgi:hypothetical protein